MSADTASKVVGLVDENNDDITASNPLRTDPTGTTSQPVTDAGGSLTVDNSAIDTNIDAPLSVIDSVLDNLLTVLTAIRDTAGVKKITDPLPAGTNNIGDVDVVSSALPTGAATESTLTTIDGVLDNLLTVLTAIRDTAGIKKITDPLPAGTNNIGDVDVVSSALPTGAATDAVAQAIRDRIGEISATPTTNTLQDRLKEIEATLTSLDGKDFSTQTTLAAVDAKLATIDAVLDSIKDTDGIKKITDELPAGTQEIGSVAQGTKAADTGAWPFKLANAAGNLIGTVLNNAIHRLETRSSITSPDGSQDLSVPADGDSTTSAKGVGILGRTAGNLFRWLLVEDSGKLVVAAGPPQPPPGSTEFILGVTPGEEEVGTGGDVSSPHDTDSAVIANGDNLFIQSLEAGTEGDPAEAGSVIEWYWVEGAGATEHLIDKFFVDGASSVIPIPDANKALDGTVMTGNGTNTFVRVRRIRLSNSAKEIHFVTRGYTET